MSSRTGLLAILGGIAILILAGVVINRGKSNKPVVGQPSTESKEPREPATASTNGKTSSSKDADVPSSKDSAPISIIPPGSTALPILATLPDFSLTDQSGEPFGMQDLREKLWVANFMFTHCQATCPRQTAEMANLQQKLRDFEIWGDLRLVSITVDPINDTPEVLTEYAKQAKADTTHWKFLTGTRDAIWELSQKGFKLPVGEAPDNATMPLSHSPKFVLVDFYGRIRGLYDGLTDPGAAELLRDIGRVYQERLPVPVEVIREEWMEPRRKNQLKTAADFQTFHDFQFSDRLQESGITFRHKVVDDGAKLFESAHYDHGTGISIADVDGDGRYDLYFVNQAGSNELWRNLGEGKFENVTEASGVGMMGKISVAAAFADSDNDGDSDLFVTTVRHGNVLFENDGSGKFKDVTEASGLGFSGHSSAAVFFDFNKDGLLDLFLANIGKYTTDEVRTVTMEPCRGEQPAEITYYRAMKGAFMNHLKPENKLHDQSILYKNLGQNRFANVTEEMQLVDNSWSGEATPLDANNDGWTDLYILNMQGHDEYYENMQGERFEKKSLAVFPNTPWGSMGVKVFDFDNDGRLDMFVTDMHSDMVRVVDPDHEKSKTDMTWPERVVQSGEFSLQPGRQSIYGNAFFHNEGNGQFKEISDSIGAENFWPWGLSVGDLNADGFDDVFISASMNFPYRYGINSVFLNEQGKRFRDSEFILGVEPRRNGRTATPWFELECEGRDREHPMVKEKNLKGRYMVWSALGSRSSVVFDLDDDGDLDIVTNEYNSEPIVLISDLAQKRPELRFLKVKLVGSKSNLDGLGAEVIVHAAGHSYKKVYDGVSGYLGHSLYPLYFGLGDTATVDSIDVVWPDGTKQNVAGPIESNRLIRVAQP